MNSYLIPIERAIFTFPILVFIATIPFMIYQYRKYGYINKFRTLIIYSFWLYCITAFYLVILPLPQSRDVLSTQAPGTKYYQLVPFKFISNFFNETNLVLTQPSTYIRIFKERAFLQPAFNALLLLPLGVYLRYYFRKSLKKTLLICFSVSLFFELTQVSALYGIYNAPYRIFDVDDLMLNTVSGVLGYKITPFLTCFFPKSEEIDKNITLSSIRVGVIRRGLAWCFDNTILVTLLWGYSNNYIIICSIMFIYFILSVYLTNGRTIGSSIFRIKVVGKNKRISFREVFMRYILFYIYVIIVYIVYSIQNRVIILMPIVIISSIFVFIDIIRYLLKRSRGFFYERISGTKLIVMEKN